MIENLILLFTVVAFAAYHGVALQIERRRAINRERELLAAVLSKNIEQYVGAVESLRRFPKDKLAEMKLENDLAQAAVKIESQGIPVR